MSNSFLKEALNRLSLADSLPLAFYDALNFLSQDGETEADLISAAKQAALVCNLELSDEELVEVLNVLAQKVSDNKQPESKKKKTLASSVSEWMAKLNGEQIALFVADFDLAKAREMYFNEPKAAMDSAYFLKVEYLLERYRVEYEACLYGFGGSYSGDGGQETEINMVDAPDEGIAKLKTLGF